MKDTSCEQGTQRTTCDIKQYGSTKAWQYKSANKTQKYRSLTCAQSMGGRHVRDDSCAHDPRSQPRRNPSSASACSGTAVQQYNHIVVVLWYSCAAVQ